MKGRDVDELIKRLLSDGSVIKVRLGNQEKEFYWQKLGYAERPLIKAYAINKIADLINKGILSVKSIQYSILVKNAMVTLQPAPSPLSSIKIKPNNIEYTFIPEAGILSFNEPLNQEIEVAYEYIDNPAYNEIYTSASACMLIYLCLRDKDEHNKKIFNSPEEVGQLSDEEINNLLNAYINNISLSESELKKSQEPQTSDYEEDTQKDIK